MDREACNWGWRSRACWIGAAGATIAAAARLHQESSGAEIHFMPLIWNPPGWLAADISVIVAAIVGGIVGQIGWTFIPWLKQRD